MVVLVASLLVLVALTLEVSSLYIRVAVAVALAAVAVQITLDGYRWQMIPAYALAATALIATGAITRQGATARRWLLRGGWIFAVVAAGVLWHYALPQIPAPDGPFAVGTEVRHLVDSKRRETLGPEGQGPRELMIQFWYPTEPAKRPRGEPATMERWLGWLRDVPATVAQPVADAPLAPSPVQYPVLIFSPSWHGQRDQNSYQVSQLVSHGFIVVGIDHPYSSAVTVFPDGRRAIAGQQDFYDLSSDGALAQSNAWNEKVLKVRVQDVEFVADELESYAAAGSGDRFSGRLDLKRLGIFGYSFGGAVAAQACWEDGRFKAGLNMDGSMYGEVAEAGVRQPFMFIDEGGPVSFLTQMAAKDSPRGRYVVQAESDTKHEDHSVETYGNYQLQIRGSEHEDFTDPPAKPPLHHYLFERGTIPVERVLTITNAYTLAFFEHYLNGATEPLLDGQSSAYPEVVLHHPSPRSGLSRVFRSG